MEGELRQRKPGNTSTNSMDDSSIIDSKEHGTSTQKNSSYFYDFLVILLILAITIPKLIYKLEKPAELVWDETHFTKFSTWYVTGHYFVDIHPPLAKLFMAALIVLSGYQPLNERNVRWWTETGFVGTQDYVNIYNSDTYIYVRSGSVIAGCILVIAGYLTMRAIGCRKITSFFTAWMLITDHLVTVDSRLILTDVYLWMFHVLTIACSFRATKAKGYFEVVFWYLFTGFMLGCSVSVKYTAFGTIGFVGIHQAIHVFFSFIDDIKNNSTLAPEKRSNFFAILGRSISQAIWKASMILFVMVVVFISVWAIHHSLLPYHGQGDGFMKDEFIRTLDYYFTEEEYAEMELGGCPNHANAWYDCGYSTITPDECIDRGCCWDPTSSSNWCYPSSRPAIPKPRKMSFITSLGHMLEATWLNNQGEELNYHPQMSRWWQWPLLMCKFVDFGFGMYTMGNPAVWWLVALTVANVVGTIVLSTPLTIAQILIPPRKQDYPIRYAGGLSATLIFVILTVGYLGNWLPFYFVVRSTWNYHYMLALLLGIILVGFSFDFLLKYSEKKKNNTLRNTVLVTMFILMILQLAAFYYWSNWIYGPWLSPQAKQHLRWYHLWGI